MDQNAARWACVIGAVVLLGFINYPWRRTKRKNRTVLEKHRAMEAWKKCVDELLFSGKTTKTKAERLAWIRQVLDAFANYLVTPQSLSKEFQKRTADIEKQCQAGNDALQRGLVFLTAKRDTLTERELK